MYVRMYVYMCCVPLTQYLHVYTHGIMMLLGHGLISVRWKL